MTDIRDLIADVLDVHCPRELGTDFIDCRCGRADFTPQREWSEHVAEAVGTELGLVEFSSDGQRWWSTKFYPLGDEEEGS